MADEFSPEVANENSPLRYGLVATVSAGRLDIGNVGWVEVDDGLERLGRGSVAQRVRQGVCPGGIFDLQGEQLGYGVVPTLGSAAAVGRSAIADGGSRLICLAGAWRAWRSAFGVRRSAFGVRRW